MRDFDVCSGDQVVPSPSVNRLVLALSAPLVPVAVRDWGFVGYGSQEPHLFSGIPAVSHTYQRIKMFTCVTAVSSCFPIDVEGSGDLLLILCQFLSSKFN